MLASLAFLPQIDPVTGLRLPILAQGWTLNYEMFFYALVALALDARYRAIGYAAFTDPSGYEALMKFRVLCSGECNVRVDLLVLYPSLLLVSLAAIVEFLVRRRKKEPDGPI